MSRVIESPARRQALAADSIMHRPASPDDLLRDAALDPYADISPSVYETARLVTMAPWLTGHADRIEYLLGQQATDGSWGLQPEADGIDYSLVPSLSATEAMLGMCLPPKAELHRSPAPLADAALGGLAALRRIMSEHRSGHRTLPDTVALELIVPDLVGRINDLVGADSAASQPPLPGLAGTNPDQLDRLRKAIAAGISIPDKLWHTWEVFANIGANAPGPRLAAGSLACSPAATAAYLGQARPEAAVTFLKGRQAALGGPVAVATPMPYFERSWVLTTLSTHGVVHRVPPGMLTELDRALTAEGCPPGPGLTPDADDTATVLLALLSNGIHRCLDPLMSFWREDHFVSYTEERTASPTTNAHALQTLSWWAAYRAAEAAAYRAVIESTTGWLLAAQSPDGHWADKWHASPYYATACCCTALAGRRADASRDALRRAADWVLVTQHPDGSWGFGGGTMEESCYAVFILTALTGRGPDDDAALSRAAGYLGSPAAKQPERPTLWIGKDLYLPARVVEAVSVAGAEVLARWERGDAHAGL